jgi:Mrp family chromosome partitioning ATPase
MSIFNQWHPFYFLQRREKNLVVLYASAKPIQAVLDALQNCEIQTRIYEALSAEGLIHGITSETSLVIYDGPESILSSPACTSESLGRTLADLSIPVVPQSAFLANPEEMFGRALLARGNRVGLDHLATRFVMITGLVGGVGKTTLSMALARRFRESLRPVALLEAGLGLSTIAHRTHAVSSLYDIYTRQTTPDIWEGVDIFAASEEQATVLTGAKEQERREKFFDRLRRDYSLVVVDAFPRHPLWPFLLAHATDMLIIATPSTEILAQADELQQELRNCNAAARQLLVVNKTRTAGERLGLSDALSIPFAEGRAQRCDPSLTDPILEALYPGWRRVRRSAPALRATIPVRSVEAA